MTKYLTFLFLVLSITVNAQDESIKRINETLDKWHMAASEANFDTYFEIMAEDGVFLGTDASENWQNSDFKAYSQPYFAKGKAWSFTPVQRNVYVSESKDIAWFDELLKTQMELCRGSGVLVKLNDKWRIQHYVLSLTIPNDEVNSVAAAKRKKDSLFISQLKIIKTYPKQN